jgi:hypothetical protein
MTIFFKILSGNMKPEDGMGELSKFGGKIGFEVSNDKFMGYDLNEKA